MERPRRSAAPAVTASLKPNAAAVVSLTAGIVFVVLLGMAAIAGYVAADAAGRIGRGPRRPTSCSPPARAAGARRDRVRLARARPRPAAAGRRSARAAAFGLGLGAVGLLVGGCVMSTILPNLHAPRAGRPRGLPEQPPADRHRDRLVRLRRPVPRYPDSLDRLVQTGMLTPGALGLPRPASSSRVRRPPRRRDVPQLLRLPRRGPHEHVGRPDGGPRCTNSRRPGTATGARAVRGRLHRLLPRRADAATGPRAAGRPEPPAVGRGGAAVTVNCQLPIANCRLPISTAMAEADGRLCFPVTRASSPCERHGRQGNLSLYSSRALSTGWKPVSQSPRTDMPQVSCPHCGQPYEIPPEQWPLYEGRQITCTRCNQAFPVLGAGRGPRRPAAAGGARRCPAGRLSARGRIRRAATRLPADIRAPAVRMSRRSRGWAAGRSR